MELILFITIILICLIILAYRRVFIIPQNLTRDQLAFYNGKYYKPCLIAVMWRVYDVQSSKLLSNPYHGYGSLWLGKDATKGLALTSLKAENCNQYDWENLTEEQLESLGEWVKHFNSKYPVVSTLSSYYDAPIPEEKLKIVMDVEKDKKISENTADE